MTSIIPMKTAKRVVSALVAATLWLSSTPPRAAAQSLQVSLQGHVPVNAIAKSQMLGRLRSTQKLSLALALPLRNQEELDDLLGGLYNANDARYGKYLSSDEFTEHFCPTQADYDQVIAFARANGLKVTQTHPNRLLVDVEGSQTAIEAAFGVQLMQFQHRDGHRFFAPNAEPVVPAAVGDKLAGIIGLENAAVWHTHNRLLPAALLPRLLPYQIGTGMGGGLAPSDIKIAYNLNTTSLTGAGQTLAIFSLSGYNANYIKTYANYYQIPQVPLQNVLVDGGSGTINSNGQAETCLDIELQMAIAPGATKIMVYQGPNSGQGVLDTYNKIATDNVAKQISSSWGAPEDANSTSFFQRENTIFQQMAAQGQCLYAAAGDNGAYDDPYTNRPIVDDPSSQPYVVGVGGTHLYVNSDRSYNHESTWNNDGAGGGGISRVWTIPSWQLSVVTAASKGSTTYRNVPDVSLNADNYTGYSVYDGSWNVYGGTSCAAPIWAAFTALVNQQRVANGQGVLGFANPTLYPLLSNARSGSSLRGGRTTPTNYEASHTVSYASAFHDIADNSNNDYYYAVTGYDDATGLGSFNGANLIQALAPVASGPAIYTPSAATFAGSDANTAGNWKGVYGTKGYVVLGDSANYPTFAKVGETGASFYTWSASTTDTRALLKPASTTDRIASSAYSATSFTYDISLTDGNTHKISIYCLDWDRRSRAEKIEILNVSTGAVLDTETVSNFATGKYLTWNAKGHVQVRITFTGGLNAVLSGIFFD